MGESFIERLKEKMAGEIVLSLDFGKTLRKWRELFGVSQSELAKKLRVSPSVISDYEAQRRKSPGISLVRKIIEALIKIDQEKGGSVLQSLRGTTLEHYSSAIIDMKEFLIPVRAKEICNALKSEVVANTHLLEQNVYGYTVVDSIKAILELSTYEFIRIYGITSKRALIFTGVSVGRSPMVAIRVTNIKPSLVVLHGTDHVDQLGIKLAEVDKIPLAICKLPKVESIVENLRRFA
ncbi:MAG: helix-turn-helix domain-containing protein [Euryarchaeota archaeon]|nr:helix-turn-helix domain-containing protein [Euryarchaeota archaeon]